MDGVMNHFPAENALYCRILYLQSQKMFRRWYPWTSTETPPGAWT